MVTWGPFFLRLKARTTVRAFLFVVLEDFGAE